MSDTINDGGPAFPCEGGIFSRLHPAYGMSLRDTFAMAAMQGALAGRKCDLGDVHQGDMSVSCYIIADAMLKAREATSGNH